jgi:hypothetical protein
MHFAINIKLAFKGFTAVVLPLLCVLKAHTHRIPVRINDGLQNINLEFIKDVIDMAPDKRELLLLFKKDIIKALYILAVKTVLLDWPVLFLPVLF